MKFFKKVEIQHLDIDESLDCYWQAIIGKEQKEWYANEIYQREVLGIKTLDDNALRELGQHKRGRKYFQGAINYEILSNLKYCDVFQYQSVDMRNEPEDFETSDMISKMVYLGDHFRYGDPAQSNVLKTDQLQYERSSMS